MLKLNSQFSGPLTYLTFGVEFRHDIANQVHQQADGVGQLRIEPLYVDELNSGTI